MEEIVKLLTFGAEIEAVDFDRRDLEEFGYKWDTKELTLVNSDGNPIRPKSEEYRLGGEIKLDPEETPESFLEALFKAFSRLRNVGAKINYRCNFQVHIGLEKLFKTLELTEADKLNFLKLLLRYYTENGEPLVRQTMGQTNWVKDPNYHRGFWLHHIERPLLPHKYKFAMKSKTLREFRESFKKHKSGKVHPFDMQRAYVNIHQYFKTQSIEYRNFYGTLDDWEGESCFWWSLETFLRAINETNKVMVIDIEDEGNGFIYPKRPPYDGDLENSFHKLKKQRYDHDY